MPSIVCIAGNNRPGNYTSQTLAIVVAALHRAGAKVEVFDGAHMNLNFPNQEITADAVAMSAAVKEADAVVFATPEYHGTFTAYAKLMIENLGYPSTLKDKPVSLLGVAGGRIGAVKSIEHLRSCLAHLGAVVLPGSISVACVRDMFDASGVCVDADTQLSLERLASRTLEFLEYYRR